MSAASPASFQAALRAAVDRRGLPLDRVVAHLRARGHSMSVATLSYWQSGRSVPSRQSSLLALGALEAILQVPRGSLARLVPMPVADVAARPTPRLADVMAQRARVDAILRDLNRELDDGVSLISVHMHAFADGTGQIPGSSLARRSPRRATGWLRTSCREGIRSATSRSRSPPSWGATCGA